MYRITCQKRRVLVCIQLFTVVLLKTNRALGFIPLVENERFFLGASKPSDYSPKPFAESAVLGPDLSTKPDYENIHGPLGPFMDSVFQNLFRSELEKAVGLNATKPGFEGITELAAYMNFALPPEEVHDKARTVLNRLFPSWMPSSYAVLFSEPFPQFSSRMNAWATYVAGTWLMGECEINDTEEGKGQGLLVKRCRFLEEAGCASVCVNSCKIPTQNFFIKDMGLPLTMEPNYETFECQFSFGSIPTSETEAEAKNTPCLSRCPTAGSLKSRHNGPIAACSLIEKD